MTLPRERTTALKNARDFLRRLLSPYNGGIKKIPSEVRQEARFILKHMISDWEVEKITSCPRCSKILGKVE